MFDFHFGGRLDLRGIGSGGGERMVPSAGISTGFCKMGYVKTARSDRIAKPPFTFKQHVPFLKRL